MNWVPDEMSGAQGNPPAFAHIGITVPSLDAAVAWYRDVLGLDPIVDSVQVEAGKGHAGRVAADVFGREFRRFRQAHLMTANGVALELFEFADPSMEDSAGALRHRSTGCFHFCLTDRDIERTVERIARAGGRVRSRIWETAPGSGFRLCYCEDPFGNIVELYSHSHERVYAGSTATGGEVALTVKGLACSLDAPTSSD